MLGKSMRRCVLFGDNHNFQGGVHDHQASTRVFPAPKTGFRTQPYSPVAKWMAEVDIALNDEGQQYGNLDEASAIARVPRKGMVIWCGDHKQTPGGLRKSEEARAFRRKLMKSPLP